MARAISDVVGQVTWKHWVGGSMAAVGMNVGILGGMVGVYRWIYADELESNKKFAATYGTVPSERHRMEAFAYAAEKWDKTMGKAEETGADLYRKQLLVKAKGDILEVAVGTGRCFSMLEETASVKSFVGVDKVQEMLDVAEKKLSGLGFPARLVRADSKKLPFPDRSFDTVIGSLCLCSVEHPVESLNEMARVCRENGRILLVEPGLSKYGPVREAQDWLGLVPDPRHAWVTGWFDNREPSKLVRKADRLKLVSIETSKLGNWYMITAVPRVPQDVATSTHGDE
mmetsp:Transcript_75902/g.180391  ORF Transcript_75902/g.180391 Transcript_75902/m.180391 type:complete len:285 (+) Transcript_75902:60-914(+)